MKKCPKCQNLYTDDTLGFCLQDGTALFNSVDHPASAETLEMRIGPTQSMSDPVLTGNSGRVSGQIGAGAEPRATKALVSGVFVIAALLLVLVVILAGFLTRGVLWDTERGRRGRGANTNANTSGGTTALKITPSASSTRAAMNGNVYDPVNLTDENSGTAWIEGADGPGAGSWIKFDFDREVALDSIKIFPGYFKSSAIWKKNNRVAEMTIWFSDGSSVKASFPDQMDAQDVAAGGVRTRWVKMTIDEYYSGTTDVNDTAISEVKFAWKP